MQHLEGSGTPVLYIGRTFLKVNYSFLQRHARSYSRAIIWIE